MAHPTVVQAYAEAARREKQLMAELETVRATKTKHYSQVIEHLRERGPLTCSFAGTTELLTLVVRKTQGSLGGQGGQLQASSVSSVEAHLSTPLPHPNGKSRKA